MKLSLVISVILLFQTFIIPQKGEANIAPPAYIGVRKGDWVEYSHSFYYARANPLAARAVNVYECAFPRTIEDSLFF